MTPFELLEPTSLHEAIGLLDPDDSTVRPIAGGTALMLMMKAGVFRPTRLVSLRKLGARYSSVAAGKARPPTPRGAPPRAPRPAAPPGAPRAPRTTSPPLRPPHPPA